MKNYEELNWVNDETELSAENFNHMEEGIAKASNIELIAVTSEAPTEYKLGDKYYNTTDDLIYTCISTGWDNGEEPLVGPFYVVLKDQSSYYYDGETMVSVGGGTEDILIQDEEPTTDDWKLWIDTGEIIPTDQEIYIGSEEPDQDYKMWLKKSRNLFNKSTITIGKRFGSDGGIIDDPTAFTSAYIEVKPNTTYSMNYDITYISRYCEYDRNKNFISVHSSGKTFTTTSNTKYIMIAQDLTTLESIMVNEGNEPLPYEPYKYNEILIKDEEEYKKYTDTLSIGLDSNNAGLYVAISDNIFNKNNSVDNRYVWVQDNAEQITSNANYWSTGKMQVKPNTAYYYNNSNVANYVVYYNVNGTVRMENDTTNITPGNGETFIQLSFQKSKIPYNTDLMISPIQNAPYEPYVTSDIKVKGETIVSKNLYSPNEVVIGEWFGKPLYRKVLYKQNGFTETTNIPHNISNLDKVVNYSGTAKFYNNIRVLPVIHSSNMAAYSIGVYGIDATNVNVQVGKTLADGNAVTDLYVSIEYTKTTD